jgi:hypothetical protein
VLITPKNPNVAPPKYKVYIAIFARFHVSSPAPPPLPVS